MRYLKLLARKEYTSVVYLNIIVFTLSQEMGVILQILKTNLSQSTNLLFKYLILKKLIGFNNN